MRERERARERERDGACARGREREGGQKKPCTDCGGETKRPSAQQVPVLHQRLRGSPTRLKSWRGIAKFIGRCVTPPFPLPPRTLRSHALFRSLSLVGALSLTHTHRHTNIRAHTHAPRITPSMTAPTSQGTARPTRTHVRRTRRSDLKSVRFDINKPLLSEPGTYKTVKARFWPWRPDKSPSPLSNCSHFDRRLRACAQAKPRCGAPQEAGASGYEPHGRPCGS